MKNMRRILALALAIIMVFALAACGGNADDQGKTDGDEKKTLVMATNAAFPPYEYKEGDAIVGIDAEIAQAIAEKLGMELEIKDVDFGAIIGGVQSGKYDFGMAGMTVTDERKESVDFTDTYANAVQVVIVKEDCKYESYEDFYTGFDADGNPAGVKDDIAIGVQQDTTGDIYSSDEAKNWGFGEDRVTKFKTGADAVEALKAGKVMAVIIDNEPAKSFVAANEGLKIMEASYAEEDYAICVAKDNTELRDKINTALKELIADGTVQKIIDKYIPAEAE